MKIAGSRRELMQRLAEFGIRSVSDYAEVLVAEALRGRRVPNRITKGHDVTTDAYGKVEVKCRQLPPGGRIEERVQVSAAKEAGFDFLAIVIFNVDFSVKGATLVPYADVWELVLHQRYNRIAYSQATHLGGAVDITEAVRRASET